MLIGQYSPFEVWVLSSVGAFYCLGKQCRGSCRTNRKELLCRSLFSCKLLGGGRRANHNIIVICIYHFFYYLDIIVLAIRDKSGTSPCLSIIITEDRVLGFID